jgi:hypothetical protein
VAKKCEWLLFENRKQILRNGVGKLVNLSPRRFRYAISTARELDWHYVNEIR